MSACFQAFRCRTEPRVLLIVTTPFDDWHFGATLIELTPGLRKARLRCEISLPTGEVTIASKYRYLQGHPKSYKFSGQTGQFSQGDTALGSKLVIQPCCWRIFEENLFERGRKELWAEVFFIDDKNCLSVVMFNNTSVNVLFGLIEPLFYEDLSLSDVVLTITSEKKENTKITPKGTYYIAKFSYVPADPALVKEHAEFVRDHGVYRADTLLPTSENKAVSKGYYNALLYADHQPLSLGEGQADETQPAV